MRFAGPAGHVRADLGDESQGGIGPDGVDLCEVHSGELVERAADFEARGVLVPLPAARRWPRCPGKGVLGGHVLQQGFDLAIAGADLALIALVELKVLSEHKDLLPAVVPREGRGDLLLGGSAAGVAMGGSRVGVGHTAGDIADDLHPRQARDVGDHVVEVDVHQGQGLLHPSDVIGGLLDQRLPMPEVGAQRDDFR